LRHELHVDDPKTYVKPITFSVPLTTPSGGYTLLPYECHEGNYTMMAGSLSGQRAEDRALEADRARGIVRDRKAVQAPVQAEGRTLSGGINER